MKTLIKSILIVVVMFGTYTGYASETLEILPTFKFVNEGNDITVSDSSGEVIYRGQINYSGNLIRLFDFSQLEDGIYTIEINKDFEIEVLDLEVKNKVVTLLVESQEKIYKPVFRNEESTLIVSKIALDSSEMKVELYYENELIYTENVEEQKDILNRVYKLDKTLSGNYAVIIKTNNRSFIKNFRI